MEHQRARKGALVALVVALVGAVGVSTASATSHPIRRATATTIKTPPFKVMVTGDFTSQQMAFAVPETVPAVKAALKDVPNVQILSCDTKGDAGAAQQCEQKAVDEGVAAVIQGFGYISQDEKILTDAKIPVLGTTDFTSPNSYALSTATGLYAANGIGLAKAGCKKLGILYLEGTDFLVDSVRDGAKSAGAKEVARAAIPANAPDLSPAVSRLVSAGAQCIALSVIPTQVVQAVTAVRQTGKNLPMAAVSAILTKDVLASLGDAANGILVVDNAANGTDTKVPGIAQLTKDMKKIDPGAEVTEIAIFSWVAGRMVAAAAAKATAPITAASLTTALDGLRNVDMLGATHPISVIPRSNPANARLFNGWGITYKIKNGKPTRVSSFYDLSPVIGS